MKATQKEIEKVISLLLQTDSLTLIGKLSELEAEKIQLESSIAQLNQDNLQGEFTENEIKTVFASIREKLKSGDLRNIKQVIDTYINQIVIYPDEARVQFNFFPNISVKFDDEIEKDRPITEGVADLRGRSISCKNHQNADDFGGEGGI